MLLIAQLVYQIQIGSLMLMGGKQRNAVSHRWRFVRLERFEHQFGDHGAERCAALLGKLAHPRHYLDRDVQRGSHRNVNVPQVDL